MSDSTASYSFPVMGEGRLDYSSACSYKTSDWLINAGQVEMTHTIEGDSLVSRLIKEDKAGFGCVVTIPSTMYRLIVKCEETGALSAKHNFNIEERNRSVEIVKFLPIVFYKGKEQKFVGDSSMGLDEIWNGHQFTLHKGAIIARDSWHEILPMMSHLIRFFDGETILKGRMEVDVADEGGGYFRVRLSSDLYESFKRTSKPVHRQHRNSIATHALSIGLAKLQNQESGDVDWDLLENFQALKRVLQEKYKAWDEPDFDPNKAACAYRPHCLNISLTEDGE